MQDGSSGGAGQDIEIPPVVTFTSGAALLVQLGIVSSMTREGVRKIAKTDPGWPFGGGRAHGYKKIANAQAMDTKPFLEFFEARRVRGRGPDRRPRRTRAAQ